MKKFSAANSHKISPDEKKVFTLPDEFKISNYYNNNNVGRNDMKPRNSISY